MKKFLAGCLFISLGLPLIELVTDSIGYLDTKVKLAINKLAEESQPTSSHAIGFQVYDEEEFENEDDE